MVNTVFFIKILLSINKIKLLKILSIYKQTKFIKSKKKKYAPKNG